MFGFFIAKLAFFARLILFTIAFVSGIDLVLLFRTPKGLAAVRETGERLSNGDKNQIYLVVENFYSFQVKVGIIDELPEQFQIRDQEFHITLAPGTRQTIAYSLRPVTRGEYIFGAVNLFVTSPIGFIKRRYKFSQDKIVAVYPSFIQMRKYELHAISNHLTELGIKKIRRIGHTLEFEHIREYVQGDDYRTINWKATARKAAIMVNEFQDEKSQQVYCIIDMGRVMEMPFQGMSLLDYGINASLALSNIAIRKQDRAGIITFSETVNSILAADRKNTQMQKILDLLYNQKTRFLESNFEYLCAIVKQKIKQRSLLLFFTNFETVTSMRRQLPYLRGLAKNHLLVMIFFENTELKKLLDIPGENTEDIYIKTIAEKFAYEKRQIVKEFVSHGIHAILTTPQNLTTSTINKYLELKARGLS